MLRFIRKARLATWAQRCSSSSLKRPCQNMRTQPWGKTSLRFTRDSWAQMVRMLTCPIKKTSNRLCPSLQACRLKNSLKLRVLIHSRLELLSWQCSSSHQSQWRRNLTCSTTLQMPVAILEMVSTFRMLWTSIKLFYHSIFTICLTTSSKLKLSRYSTEERHVASLQLTGPRRCKVS